MLCYYCINLLSCSLSGLSCLLFGFLELSSSIAGQFVPTAPFRSHLSPDLVPLQSSPSGRTKGIFLAPNFSFSETCHLHTPYTGCTFPWKCLIKIHDEKLLLCLVFISLLP